MHLYEIWAREPNFESLRQHLNFFNLLYFGPHNIGTLEEPQHQRVLFIFLLWITSYLAEGLWDQTLTSPFIFFIYFSLSMSSFLWGCGIKPSQPLFIFLLFSSLNLPKKSWVWFPHASPFIFIFILLFSLNLPKRSWVRFPRLTFLFFLFSLCPLLSFTTLRSWVRFPHLYFFSFIFPLLPLASWRSWVRFPRLPFYFY